MKGEVIESIVEFVHVHDEELFTTMGGFLVKTDCQTIRLAFEDEQDCCEAWDYSWKGDPQAFVGAILQDVTVGERYCVDDGSPDDDEERATVAQKVVLHTDRGDLTFQVENNHNGYYNHWLKVQSQQLTYSGRI